MKQVFKKYKSLLISVFSLLLFFLLWELLLNVFDVSRAVLIKPSDILETSLEDYDILIEAMIYTTKEIIPGWIIGNSLGFLFALLTYKNETIAKPFVKTSVLINSIPLIALTAIIGGIMGTNRDQKILIVSLITFFPTFIITLSELTTINDGHKDLMHSYSATRKQILRKILLPKSLPAILNSVKVTIITAIFTAITAEFFGGYGGIGIFILSKKGLCNLNLVWAGISFIAIFGSLFYFGFEFLEKKIVKWQRN